MQNKKTKVEHKDVETDSLLIAEYNPRTISAKKLEMLKKSITEDSEFLSVRPLIVNMYPGRENIVIGGNQRLLAARELGLKTVPAIIVSIDPTREKIWNIKDNAGYGEWEGGLLKEVIIQLQEESADLELVGFDESEIGAILNEEFAKNPDDIDVDAKLNKTFEVVIDCQNETQQNEIFNRLKADGYMVRVLTI